MANLSIRRENPSSILPEDYGWNPLRSMRDLMRWDPFAEMGGMTAVNQVTAFNPQFDVRETKDAFIFKGDVPGIKEADLSITFSNNRLSISGKREVEQEEKTETYYRSEREYGSFTRSFMLPNDIDSDHTQAELKSGVLTIQVPKSRTSTTKTIPLQKPKV